MQEMRQLRVGLLGAGRIGKLHAANLASRADVRLEFVVDSNAAAAEALAAPARAGVFSALSDALDRATCDAVMICSPTDTHVDAIEMVAGRGLAIFCEKPIDLSIARVDQAVAAVRRHGVPFMIGFHRRFDPTHRAAHDALGSGRIGRLEQMAIVARDPGPPPAEYVTRSGGIFRDMMIHDLDQARFLSGSEFVGVYARGADLIGAGFTALGDVDTASAVFWTAEGVVCTIQNSRRAVYGFDQRIELFGERGALRIENPRPTLLTVDDAAGTHADRLFDHFPGRYAAAYRAEMDHFISGVRDGTLLDPGVEDARRSLVLADAAALSLREGRPVDIRYG